MACHRAVTIGYCFVVLTVLWSICVEVVFGLPGYYPDNKAYDLCKESRLAFSMPGTHGQIVFNSSSLKPLATNPCILRIETCSSCRFKIQMPKSPYIDFFCEGHSRSNSGCSLSCDYLYVFDTNYMNDTLIYYDSWASFKTEYVSLSNNVFIGLCHGYREKYSIVIDFEVERKVQIISGTPEYKAHGVFMSPLFPKQYDQYEETYEYNLTNHVPNGVIQVMFSDWHLAESSHFIFENSNIVGRVSGKSIRPVIVSNTNTMMVRFHTGISQFARSSSDYIGFKADYQLLSDKSMERIPNTKCEGSGYLFNEFGGAIDFEPIDKRVKLYDCLWVIKKQPGYSGIYLKILKYTSPRFVGRGVNKLYIKSGLTSNGYTVIEIDQEDRIEDGIPYKDTKGFYIRLNGTYTSSDTFRFVFASYQAHYECQPNMFKCASGNCIHPSLKCDGYDHCGDNSDETTVCGDPASHWDKSYQYTVTIGVIIPMVISVFLIMIICLLFVMIRRCRRIRMQEAGSSERLRTLSEDVSRTRGRRRRRHRRNMFGERDMPPTYDEAMQNPPGWYLNVAFANPVDPSLPQPPSYTEAMRQQSHSSPTRRRPGSPDSTDSSQSELTICSRNQSASSSSSDEDERWYGNDGNTDGRRARRSRHVSSSDTERETEANSDRTASRQTVRENNTQTTQLQPRASPSADITPYCSDQEGKKTGHSENFEMSEKSDKNDPKKTDGPTDCVVPDHDKVDTEPDTRSYASRIVQSVLGSRTGSYRQPRADRSGNHSRQRSRSSESETVGDESRRKGKKKHRKSKNKRSKSSKNPAIECLPEQTHPNVSEQVPFPEVGATNFTTDDIPNHSESRTAGPNTSELERRCRTLPVRTSAVEKPNPGGSEDSLNYELVVNVDNDDVMLVYDTHFCDIPQQRDHFSQSRSGSGDTQIQLVTDDHSESNGTENGRNSPQQSHGMDKPDVDHPSHLVSHIDECDETGLEGLHVRQNRDNDPVTHVPLDGVQYISIRSDDLGDDIYV